MASPQTENGFTRVANEILEQVTQYKFNGTQYKLIMVVWRFTYGFSRQQHEFSNSFFAEATGANLKTIKKELGRLIEELVITEVAPATFKSGRILAFNKNYETWKTERTIDHQGANYGGGGQLTTTGPIDHQEANDTPGEGANCHPGEGANRPPKKESIKESIKEIDNNNNEPANAFAFYQQNFGVMSAFIAEDLGQWIDDLNQDLVIEAMKRALEQNKRTWGYIKSILSDWAQKGFSSLEQIEAADLEFRNRTSKRGEQQNGKHEQGNTEFGSKWGRALEQRKNTAAKF